MTPERWRAVREAFDAVVGLAPAERAVRLADLEARDLELAREVRSLVEADAAAGTGFLSTPAPLHALGAPNGALRGRRVGPYELGEVIGRGGMGEVYGARRVDGQYAQEVAVKIVRAGIAAPLLVERFRNERQILATLAHDNIARLLDGGTTEDGIPYLVMEYVRGQPIDAYCDAQRLPVTARLRLFERVCAAVEHAHRHLVVHRDLKPSNILVTEAGEPKLLDFGIAKILDAPAAAETTVLRPMTPEYASPEQLRGAPVTTATDVYSLGVVLYRLLTGCSPFGAVRRAAPAAARADDAPPLPSAVVLRELTDEPGAEGEGTSCESRAEQREGTAIRLSRRLRGDLDHILLKALRPEPAQRYSSVEQLAADLRRHLDGLPVLARRGGWRYLAGRFLYRHRVAAVASAAVLATVIGGAFVALHEARIAAENARRAETRFDDVRHLANSLIFEIHDAIEPLAGSTAVRELIVRRALDYLDRLSREAAGDAALRRELALAYEKVGAVQGAQSGNNLGDLQGALASYRNALAIREALQRLAPADGSLAVAIAHDEGEIAGLRKALGSLDESIAGYRRGIARLTAGGTPGPDATAELQRLRTGYGTALIASGDLETAVAELKEADRLGEARLRAHPDDPQAAFDRATTLSQLGDALRKSGRAEAALAALQSGVAVLVPYANGDHPQWRRDLFVLKERVADVLMQLGRFAEELVLRQETLDADLAAERADPANARARRDVYIDYYKLSRAHLYAHRTEQALVAERACLARIERELAANPGNAVVREDAAINYYMLGEILDQAKRPAEALTALLRSQAFTQQIMQANPADQKVRAEFAEGERKVGDVALRVGNRTEALVRYRRSVDEFEAVVQRDPADSIIRSALATSYQHLGHYYLEAARRAAADDPASAPAAFWAEAADWLGRSVEIWRDLKRSGRLAAEDAAEPPSAEADLREAHAALGRRSRAPSS